MKKVCLTTIIALFSLTSMSAQGVDFGITAGLLNGAETAKTEDITLSESEAGFYGGLVIDIDLTEKLHIQPELLYALVGEVSFLQLPIIAKYYVTEKLNILAGPQMTYTLQANLGDDVTNINIGIGAGLGYDFTDNLFIQSRYTFQLNNYYLGSENFSSKIEFFNVGLGYQF